MLKSPPRNAGPPRVMHVITPSHMAGAEMFLVRLLHRTAQNGHTSHCISKPGPANAEMQAAGLSFETLGIGGKANLLAIPRLLQAARRHRVDVLHSHLSSASWWCGWLERLGGPPSIGHVHGFTSRLWHQRQSHLIACSAAVKRHLMTKGFTGERITVLHYPVDAGDMQPTRSAADVRAQLGATSETPIVGTFAHLSVKKGYRELVQAAAVVLRRLPTAQFWCFGEGPLRVELEQAARELGIESRFRLFGFRRDVPDLMRAIDVMCLPSHREPFGLVYVEAALAEKPVIACKAGGAPEIIEHMASGLLVPPPQRAGESSDIHSAASAEVNANVAPLADAILALLNNRDQAAAMGRRARELVFDRFGGWQSYLSRLNELYECVRARRPVRAFHSADAAA